MLISCHRVKIEIETYISEETKWWSLNLFHINKPSPESWGHDLCVHGEEDLQGNQFPEPNKQTSVMFPVRL